MFDTLILPFQFPFMIKAMITVLIVTPPAAFISCYLVLKGWALIGDAIGHALLPGIILAFLVGLPVILGAFFSGLACAILSGFVSQKSRIKEDTALGIVFSSMFAFGLVIYSKINTKIQIDHVLFGNMFGVSQSDILISCLITFSVLTFLTVKRMDFLLYCFDPIFGRAVGLKINFLHYSLLVLISLSVVSAFSAVGLILTIGILIIPGSIGYLLTKQFERMLIVAVTVTTICSLLGVYVSFFLDSAPAPTIILMLSIIFLLVIIVNSLLRRLISAKMAR